MNGGYKMNITEASFNTIYETYKKIFNLYDYSIIASLVKNRSMLFLITDKENKICCGLMTDDFNSLGYFLNNKVKKLIENT